MSATTDAIGTWDWADLGVHYHNEQTAAPNGDKSRWMYRRVPYQSELREVPYINVRVVNRCGPRRVKHEPVSDDERDIAQVQPPDILPEVLQDIQESMQGMAALLAHISHRVDFAANSLERVEARIKILTHTVETQEARGSILRTPSKGTRRRLTRRGTPSTKYILGCRRHPPGPN